MRRKPDVKQVLQRAVAPSAPPPSTVPTLPAFASSQPALRPNNFQLSPTSGLQDWLAANDCCVAFTTYQSGQVFVIGRKVDGAMMYTVRTYERAMGLALRGDELHLGTFYQIWHFRRRPAGALPSGDYDAAFTPRSCHVTGHVAIHDLAVEDTGRLLFVNTLYNCLCTTDEEYSFRPVWKPDWIASLAAEDRCHLNGLALRDGRARYVTAVARTDVKDGWRAGRVGSGVLWDICENRPVLEGLTMPHSPRWHRDRIYFINSGTGFLCSVAPGEASPTEIAFIPGFARGLAVYGNHALVGTSAQRANRTFSDLPLEQNLASRGLVGRCALHVVNLTTGVVEHSLLIDGDIQEVYDIAVLPGLRMANVIGFMNPDVHQNHDVPPPG